MESCGHFYGQPSFEWREFYRIHQESLQQQHHLYEENPEEIERQQMQLSNYQRHQTLISINIACSPNPSPNGALSYCALSHLVIYVIDFNSI